MNDKQKRVFTTTQTYIRTFFLMSIFTFWVFFITGYLIIDMTTSGSMSLEKAANLSTLIGIAPVIIWLFVLIISSKVLKKNYIFRTGNPYLFYISLFIFTAAILLSGLKYLEIKAEQKFLDFETNIIMSNPDWKNSSNEKVLEFLTYKKESDNFQKCIKKCGIYLIEIHKNKELYKI